MDLKIRTVSVFKTTINRLINRKNQSKTVFVTVTKFSFYQEPNGFQNRTEPVLSILKSQGSTQF
jgi:hypothetical protein